MTQPSTRDLAHGDTSAADAGSIPTAPCDTLTMHSGEEAPCGLPVIAFVSGSGYFHATRYELVNDHTPTVRGRTRPSESEVLAVRRAYGLPENRERQTERTIAAVERRAQDAISAELHQHFPYTTGDVSPDAQADLDDALAQYVRRWVAANVPEPLTLPEAVAALIEARNALALALNASTVEAVQDAQSAYGVVVDALARSPLTEDDLPRP